jgi:carbonic anhydrase
LLLQPLMTNLSNTGNSAKVVFNFEGGADDDDGAPRVEGGGLPGVFRLAQLHFHWGGESHVGSEHMVAGKAFPIEMHLVHYNEK